jgi:hypothetical protein
VDVSGEANWMAGDPSRAPGALLTTVEVECYAGLQPPVGGQAAVFQLVDEVVRAADDPALPVRT